MKIQPVLLCGGSGTRLSISTDSCPKQFIQLPNGSNLFKETLIRIQGYTSILKPIIITNKKYISYMNDYKDYTIIFEPEKRNTAPAISLAAFSTLENNSNNEKVLLVLPCDHYIDNVDEFYSSIRITENSNLITDNIFAFGIKPSYPDTGYGYISAGEKLQNNMFRISKFIEKPVLNIAKQLIEQTRVLWNSGIFMFTPSMYLEELKMYSSSIYEKIKLAWNYRNLDCNNIFIYPGNAFYDSPNKSIDYAIMEHTKKAIVVQMNCIWKDIGSYKVFQDIFMR